MPVRHVVIVIHEGVQALDVAGPVDVFAEANGYVAPENRYEMRLVAAHCRPLRASNGMQMVADQDFGATLPDRAIVLVAGGPNLPHRAADTDLSRWLQEAAKRARLYGSICTGAFACGHAGLLDGRKVTTHWQNAARLAAQFPAAQVEEDRIYLRDGNLVTSAGVTAGIDLALALVREDHGAAISLAVAKRLVVFAQRQGGQSQFSPCLSMAVREDSAVARAQNHIMEHLSAPLSVAMLAEIAGVSARTFARSFVEETGITPHEFIERARVDAARQMLEGSDRALKAVAYDCGFGSADRMRIVFGKRLGITPAQYRASFQSQISDARQRA